MPTAVGIHFCAHSCGPMSQLWDGRGVKEGCLGLGGGDGVVEGHAAAVCIDGLAGDVAGCV